MMFDQLDRDDLLDVEVFLEMPIISIFESFQTFMNNSAPLIREFYEGERDSVVAEQLKELDLQVESIEETINRIDNNREEFNLYKHWVIIENLEDALQALQSLQNYKLWSRSNRNESVYAGNVEVDYVQAQNETIERIEIKTGSVDPDTTWYQTAIRNSLQEEDYTMEGGAGLKIWFKSAPTVLLQSVISPILNGYDSFGVDIQKKIEFSNDDMVKLSNKETLEQSAFILLNLRRGDNPRFPNLGFDQVSILGSNKGSILYPIIFRQIIELFSTDDTFSGIQLGEISIKQDAIFIDVEASSRFKATVEGLIQL